MRKHLSGKFQSDFLKYYEQNFESAQEFLEFFAAATTEQFDNYDDPDTGDKLAKQILQCAEKVGAIEAAIA